MRAAEVCETERSVREAEEALRVAVAKAAFALEQVGVSVRKLACGVEMKRLLEMEETEAFLFGQERIESAAVAFEQECESRQEEFEAFAGLAKAAFVRAMDIADEIASGKHDNEPEGSDGGERQEV